MWALRAARAALAAPALDAARRERQHLAAMHEPETQVQPPPPPMVAAAGFWRRGAAFVLDTLVVALISAAVWTSFDLVSWDAWPAERWNLLDQLVEVVNGQAHGLALALVAAVVAFAYGLIAEALVQGTPAKRLLGVRVIDPYGRAPGVLRLVIRNGVKVLGTALLAVGPLWCIVDRQRRALHDLASGTRVVVAGGLTSFGPRRSPASARSGHRETAR